MQDRDAGNVARNADADAGDNGNGKRGFRILFRKDRGGTQRCGGYEYPAVASVLSRGSASGASGWTTKLQIAQRRARWRELAGGGVIGGRGADLNARGPWSQESSPTRWVNQGRQTMTCFDR